MAGNRIVKKQKNTKRKSLRHENQGHDKVNAQHRKLF